MEKTVIKKSQGTFTKLIASFLRRFHLLLFFILVVGCLSAGIILINRTLIDSSSQQYTPTINAGSIDQVTLERIQSLHTSNAPANTPLPSGRINPFSE